MIITEDNPNLQFLWYQIQFFNSYKFLTKTIIILMNTNKYYEFLYIQIQFQCFDSDKFVTKFWVLHSN